MKPPSDTTRARFLLVDDHAFMRVAMGAILGTKKTPTWQLTVSPAVPGDPFLRHHDAPFSSLHRYTERVAQLRTK